MLLDKKVKVVALSCGGRHTVILDTKGQLYTCGTNNHGETGHRHGNSISVPMHVHNISRKHIDRVACGWHHTIALVAPCYVYVTGLSKFGELGLGDVDFKRGFTLIESLVPKTIQNIFAGGYHSWFLFDESKPKEAHRMPSPLLVSPADSKRENSPLHRKLIGPETFDREQLSPADSTRFNEVPKPRRNLPL
jgi:alpha-tubulin suppressor-like RCC1 family protein